MQYIGSVIFLFFIILLYPKNEEREDLFAQITFTIVTIMELQTLWAYITLDVFKIDFNLTYYTSYNFGLAFLALLCWILINNRRIQCFSIKLHSFFVVMLLCIITFFIGIWRYGSRLNLFAYCSADSANHLSAIEYIIKFEKVPSSLEGRYFLHINETLFLKSVQSWIQPMSYYRFFLFSELFFYFLSGAMFYALIEKKCICKKNILLAVLFLCIYIFGYPLNNLLYGYEYLGASVTIAIYIQYILETLVTKKKWKCQMIIALMISCFSMYRCYSLLFLGILTGIAVAIFINTINRPNVFKSGLILAGVLIILYKFNNLYEYWNRMLEKLEFDAVMYRDFWSNVLWMIPYLLIGIKEGFKEKDKAALKGIFFGMMVIMLIFMFYMYNGKIGSYYYYKFYYLLWFYWIYISFLGGISLNDKCIKVSKMYNVLIVFVIILSSVLYNRKEIEDIRKYSDIFSKNWQILLRHETNMDHQKQELFYAAAEKVKESGGMIPYIGTWEDYWNIYYYSITNQIDPNILDRQGWYARFCYANADSDINDMLKMYIYDYYGDVPYIMVERNSDAYWYGIGYYSTLEVVYENEYGFIYKR